MSALWEKKKFPSAPLHFLRPKFFVHEHKKADVKPHVFFIRAHLPEKAIPFFHTGLPFLASHASSDRTSPLEFIDFSWHQWLARLQGLRTKTLQIRSIPLLPENLYPARTIRWGRSHRVSILLPKTSRLRTLWT